VENQKNEKLIRYRKEAGNYVVKALEALNKMYIANGGVPSQSVEDAVEALFEAGKALDALTTEKLEKINIRVIKKAS